MLNILKKIVIDAGKIIEKGYDKTNLQIETKLDKTDVTEIDKAVEKYIRARLSQGFPKIPVLGEEEGGKLEKNIFILDPLDGTTNFITRIPFFNISLAYQEEGKPKIGIVYNPISKDLFYAEIGNGAYFNDKKITVKPNKNPMIGSCYATDIGKKAFGEFFNENIKNYKDIRKYGSAALEISYVAINKLDAFLGFDIKLWDFAAGEVIAKEAGLKIKQYKHDNFYTVLVANNNVFDKLEKTTDEIYKKLIK